MKKPTDYAIQVILNTRPHVVFDALTLHIDKWWGTTDENPRSIHTEFTVSWGEPWYKFKVIALETPTLIRWKCIDANQIIPGLDGVQKEWVGTTLDWNIEQLTEETSQLSFVHMGLSPGMICYNVCSNAWHNFISQKLPLYISTNPLSSIH